MTQLGDDQSVGIQSYSDAAVKQANYEKQTRKTLNQDTIK